MIEREPLNAGRGPKAFLEIGSGGSIWILGAPASGSGYDREQNRRAPAEHFPSLPPRLAYHRSTLVARPWGARHGLIRLT